MREGGVFVKPQFCEVCKVFEGYVRELVVGKSQVYEVFEVFDRYLRELVVAKV